MDIPNTYVRAKYASLTINDELRLDPALTDENFDIHARIGVDKETPSLEALFGYTSGQSQYIGVTRNTNQWTAGSRDGSLTPNYLYDGPKALHWYRTSLTSGGTTLEVGGSSKSLKMGDCRGYKFGILNNYFSRNVELQVYDFEITTPTSHYHWVPIKRLSDGKYGFFDLESGAVLIGAHGGKDLVKTITVNTKTVRNINDKPAGKYGNLFDIMPGG